jgi:hypothetical protein
MDNLESTAQTSFDSTTIAEVKERKPKSKFKRIFLFTLLALVLIGTAAQVVYTYSGSGRWELVGSQGRVTAYEMKIPGQNLKKYKGVWRVHTTLARFVKFAEDSQSNLGFGLYEVKDLDIPSEKLKWTSCKMRFPAPFQPRQVVAKNEFSQDPVTKVLTYKVTAAPDKIPPDHCCYRIALMNNIWTLTPMKNGIVQIEWVIDADAGLPYFLANYRQIPGIFWMAPKIQGFLDKEEYENASYDWVKEMDM